MNFWQPTVVAVLARLDEVVERRSPARPRPRGTAGPCRRRRAWGRAEFLGALRDLDRVLVVAHQEVDGEPFHPAEPRLDVGPDLLERRADVRPAVGVVDRRREVEPVRVALLSLIVGSPLPLAPGPPSPRPSHTIGCDTGRRGTFASEPIVAKIGSATGRTASRRRVDPSRRRPATATPGAAADMTRAMTNDPGSGMVSAARGERRRGCRPPGSRRSAGVGTPPEGRRDAGVECVEPRGVQAPAATSR